MTHRISLGRFAFVSAVVVLAACAKPGGENPVAPRGPAGSEAPQAGRGVTVGGTGEQGVFRFQLVFRTPKVGELFEVVTEVQDAKTGKPVPNATFRLDATMPEHGHGMITDPVHTPVGEGKYRSEGMKLHMPGRWQFEATATADGRTDTYRTTFTQPAIAAGGD